MNAYEVRLAPVAAEALAILPPVIEQAVRRHLEDIARAATQTPPPVDPDWARRLGLDTKSFRFSLSRYQFVYELDQRARLVILHAVGGRSPNEVNVRDTPVEPLSTQHAHLFN